MKIVLAGSPQISVNTFETIINSFEVMAIVTQPDRKQGRGMKLVETPVAILANKYGIKIFKPEKISLIKEELEKLQFDLFLTFAFGQWIPSNILSIGKLKPLNIHGSLLPKYRGAAPIHHAILNGDKVIGITLMEMIKEMDAGDMFFKASADINNETTTGEAFKIVSELANKNIVNWLNKVELGDVNPISQSSEYTIAPKIEKSFAKLSIEDTMEKTIRKVRALNPFPGSFAFIEGKRVKIFNISINWIKNSLPFKVVDGILYIIDYQFESKKRIIL